MWSTQICKSEKNMPVQLMTSEMSVGRAGEGNGCFHRQLATAFGRLASSSPLDSPASAYGLGPVPRASSKISSVPEGRCGGVVWIVCRRSTSRGDVDEGGQQS